MRVGIDTGGTFTDVIAMDDDGGDIRTYKVASSSTDPAGVVLSALEGASLRPAEVDFISFGTTVATNAAIQHHGARVFFLTTEGFEDVPFIQRITRPYAYDPTWRKPSPGVTRGDCIGVRERVSRTGDVLLALDAGEIERVCASIRARMGSAAEEQCAVAICLLFGYVNPAHEDEMAAAVRRAFPHMPTSVSHEVAPVWREYERGFSTIVDASVRAIVDDHVVQVQDALQRTGYSAPLAIMKSNGGQLDAPTASRSPIQVLLSGLAGGVIAGRFFASSVGVEDAVTFDMGGTSTDVALILGNRYGYTTEFELDWGMPVVAPMLDFRTIGAGGGSIAWEDFGGLLRVGPQSAGADPGPAAYGRGGTDATVSDANLVLGRLAADAFLGGRMELDREAAEHAVERLADALGVTTLEAAHAIVATARHNMAGAIRLVTVEKGVDCRNLALVAFGGAGPMHAVELAASLGMRQVVVPLHPGLCSAYGAALADRRTDKVQTVYFRSDSDDPSRLAEQLDVLTTDALHALRAEGFAGNPVVIRTVGMRYVGQNFEEAIPIGPDGISQSTITHIVDDFHARYEARYGYSLRAEPVEVTELAVTALGPSANPPLPRSRVSETAEPVAYRAVSFSPAGYVDTPVFIREALSPRGTIAGPAIISEEDSTTVIPPGGVVTVSPAGVLNISTSSVRVA